MDPVMACRMKQNAVCDTARTTHHTGGAVMKAPSGDPSDFCVTHRAKSVLFMPEIAKSASTPKRVQHMSAFSFFEVGFIHEIVRVGFAFYLAVPFDGSALGVVQPDLIWPSFVIAGFTEEGPVTLPAAFRSHSGWPTIRPKCGVYSVTAWGPKCKFVRGDISCDHFA